MDQKEYIVRVEGLPYSYGLGEIVSPEGAVLFKAGDYNLSKDQLDKKLKALGKATLRWQ